MRFLVAAALLVYGVAHARSALSVWGDRAAADEHPIPTGGRVAIGILWLLTAVAFAVAAAGAGFASSWWPALTLCAAGGSMALSALGWPRFGVGIPVAIVIIFAVSAGMRAGRSNDKDEEAKEPPAGCWSRSGQPSR